MSTELIEKVHTILNKASLPDRHTFFQLEKFVIGKEPTAQSQLWQIIREMQARIETVDSYRKQLEDAEDTLELFDIKIERQNRAIREESKVDLEHPNVFTKTPSFCQLSKSEIN